MRLIYGAKKQTIEMQMEFTKQLLKLVTSGFGLVAALAWNEVIKEAVEVYIKPVVGGASGIISLIIYALIVTVLAVLITYNLSKLTAKDKEKRD
jgi:ABC-type uncharacterized transport system fused permease/ATPase subunit